ncbi:MAG: hypothetical protein ACYCOR_19095 [Acidobacteriaceae bacterium]
MIPEPQKAYLLELLTALGSSAEDFVLAGAQSMKFALDNARATRDFDFLLDAVHLRERDSRVGETLGALGYQVVPESRNFQFEKQIPQSREIMRVEFMAPHELKRKKDFRVEIEQGLHARECFGGGIALRESDEHELTGVLPNGQTATVRLRVTRPTALVLLKLLALDDRYRNIRGSDEAEHDREEAQTHAADIMAVMTAIADIAKFRRGFYAQLEGQQQVGDRVMSILERYFQTDTSPGMLLYEEALRRDQPADRETRAQIRDELSRAFRMIQHLLPTGTQR